MEAADPCSYRLVRIEMSDCIFYLFGGHSKLDENIRREKRGNIYNVALLQETDGFELVLTCRIRVGGRSRSLWRRRPENLRNTNLSEMRQRVSASNLDLYCRGSSSVLFSPSLIFSRTNGEDSDASSPRSF